MIRLSAAIVALASIVSLSACGGIGGSEFATKATAACVKDQGEASAAKCGCQARIIDKALNDKEKKFLLTSMNAAEMGPEHPNQKPLTRNACAGFLSATRKPASIWCS